MYILHIYIEHAIYIHTHMPKYTFTVSTCRDCGLRGIIACLADMQHLVADMQHLVACMQDTCRKAQRHKMFSE